MPLSSPARLAPRVSPESPPRTSRQRRRRSFSSIVVHPQYLREDGQRPGRPLVVQISGPVASALWRALSPTSQRPDLLAHRAFFGGFEVREGAADEGEQGDEGLWVEACQPTVEGLPESRLVEQDQSAPPQYPLDPRGGLRRGDRRREREPGETLQFVHVEDPCLEQQPATPAAHEGVDAFVLRERTQDSTPPPGHARAVQEVHAILHAADAPCHLPRCIVVQGGARAWEGDDRALEEGVNHG